MKTTGNTILITGGGSGIGRGLAEAFHKLGNQVIISGRTAKTLDGTTAANPGMRSLTVDMTDAGSIKAFAAQLENEFPVLNVVINNAGIMKPEDLKKPSADQLEVVKSTIETNLLGPLRLTAALLPHLMTQPGATVMTVSSGLAFVPLTVAPTYNATKAAIHSWTQSLRHQLKDTKVEVLELIPPYVQTGLGGEQQENDPRAMPLDAFIKEVMEIIASEPKSGEINVQNVLRLREAEYGGREGYDQMFSFLQKMWEEGPKR